MTKTPTPAANRRKARGKKKAQPEFARCGQLHPDATALQAAGIQVTSLICTMVEGHEGRHCGMYDSPWQGDPEAQPPPKHLDSTLRELLDLENVCLECQGTTPTWQHVIRRPPQTARCRSCGHDHAIVTDGRVIHAVRCNEAELIATWLRYMARQYQSPTATALNAIADIIRRRDYRS